VSIAPYVAEIWTLRKIDQKCRKCFLNSVLEKNGEDQLDRSFEKLKYDSITVKKGRNSLHTIKLRKNDWICHIVHTNCPLNTLLREINKG